MMEEKTIARASIGVNLLVIRGTDILLGKRKNIAGDGDWGLPGGRLDRGEWIYEAAKRELAEETGLRAKQFIFAGVTHQLQAGDHWVQFGFEVSQFEGVEENLEPEVCEELKWFNPDELPENLFPAHEKLIDLWLKKRDVFGEGEVVL
jgi:8-oxo-dGTP diphosphatase